MVNYQMFSRNYNFFDSTVKRYTFITFALIDNYK